MKILTGKDKLAYKRLEFIISNYEAFLKMLRDSKAHNNLITFECTPFLIEDALRQIKNAKNGSWDTVIRDGKF